MDNLRSQQRLQPSLNTASEHEAPLMQFFAVHRIATPYDILNALPQYFAYHNKTIRHLNWLANSGYLNRHCLGDRSYVYNITNAGYERCRDKDISADLNLIPYHYREPTGKQVQHELLITGSATSLYSCMRKNPTVSILQEWRFGLKNISVVDPESGEVLHPFEHKIPDYAYISRDSNGMMFRMVEAVRGVESMDNLKNMMVEYEQWERSRAAQLWLMNLYRDHGAQNPQPEFQVHCILESSSWKHTDQWKERMTMMQTFRVSPRTQGRIWTTTFDAIQAVKAEGLTINQPIWHRGKDLMGEKRERWLNAKDGTRTRLLDSFMQTLPTYTLFA